MFFKPKSILGKLSVKLVILFFFMLAVFYLMCASGQRGGDTFFSNLYLTIPFLIAAIAGMVAFFIGILSVIKNKDYSILVILSTIIGFLILLWCLAEILFPH